jgi:hypothetical protein
MDVSTASCLSNNNADGVRRVTVSTGIPIVPMGGLEGGHKILQSYCIRIVGRRIGPEMTNERRSSNGVAIGISPKLTQEHVAIAVEHCMLESTSEQTTIRSGRMLSDTMIDLCQRAVVRHSFQPPPTNVRSYSVVRSVVECAVDQVLIIGVYVKSRTGQQRTSREKKAVVLMELHRAIIYTTEMSKQVTKCHVRDAVHMYPVN